MIFVVFILFSYFYLKSMGNIVLLSTQFFALVCSLYGLYWIYCLEDGLLFSMHTTIWFIFCTLSNLFGILSIATEIWEGRTASGSYGLRTLQALQYHYFFAWMDVLAGYAGIVTYSWHMYNPQRLSHLHMGLMGVPIVAWLKRKSALIVASTQTVTSLAIMSHSYIGLLSGNWWQIIGAFLMTLHIIAMSLPVRFTFILNNFSTREAAIFLAGLASLVFPRSIEVASKSENFIY